MNGNVSETNRGAHTESRATYLSLKRDYPKCAGYRLRNAAIRDGRAADVEAVTRELSQRPCLNINQSSFLTGFCKARLEKGAENGMFKTTFLGLRIQYVTKTLLDPIIETKEAA